jgi:hypothetical protein
MNATILGLLASCLLGGGPLPGSCLYQPAYCRENVLIGPAEPYVPQAGDIFLATDRAVWCRLGHLACGGRGVHHSGIVFAMPDGRLALIEAGPFNKKQIEVMDPFAHMGQHIALGDIVWVRRRRVPLTPEQSARLTAFLTPQIGKRFALWRMLAQVTPLKSRGWLRTPFLGKPHGPNRVSYFCSEMVTESLVAAGLFDACTSRPSAMYPRDLFYGRSFVPYIDRHLDMDGGWYPPARWMPWSP